MTVKISNKRGFIFTIEDLRNPDGVNGLSSFAAMFQRTLYKEKIYPGPLAGIPRPLDTWYKRGYFGRIDSKQNTVIPKTANLKQISDAKQPLFALNFVADAFAKFTMHMGSALLAGSLFTKEVNNDIVRPSAKLAYRDPTRMYNDLHATLARTFVLSFQPPPSKPIDNFKTFLKYYIPYLKSVVPVFPITKTGYVLTYNMDPMCTGLSIAISNLNPGDDPLKYEKYITDPNFRFYTNVAKKFGFLVDKNKPWILTADLFSPALMEHVDYYLTPNTRERITRANFFDTYYNRTYLTDFDDLRRLLLSAYRFLVSSSEIYQQQKICSEGKFSYRNYAREPYNEESHLADLEPQMLIDLYIDLRQAESQNSYTLDQVARLKKDAYDLYSLRVPPEMGTPYERVAEEVNHRYRKYIYPSNISQLTGIATSSRKEHGRKRADDRKLKR